jgi:Gpi18-like mannosyltransferase
MNKASTENLIFPTLMWLSSRILLILTMLILLPIISKNPEFQKYGWWDVFFAWDSIWYYQIVHSGYNYGLDGKQYSVAFFPLYPLTIKALMLLGIPFPWAALLINNLAFLAALIVLYGWMEEKYGKNAARWATATLAWCPYSIYCTVIYTEGLFLLFSTSALRAFHRREYGWVALWGGLTTATRITGVALIPAFLLASWKEKRPLKAYIASCMVAGGLLLYILFCFLKFGDGFAFLQAQRGWRTSVGFVGQGWWRLAIQIFVGIDNLEPGNIRNITHPMIVILILLSMILIWRFRQKLSPAFQCYGFYLLWFCLWLQTRATPSNNIFLGEPLVKIAIIFGGLVLLWYYRLQLPFSAVVYALVTYGIILNTGLIASVERYTYAIAPLSLALGLLLARDPRWGYPLMVFFGILMVLFSLLFAQDMWLA